MPDRIARRTFLGGVAALAGGVITRAQTQTASAPGGPLTMYVGSFTGEGRGRGEGLSVFARQTASDPWALVQVVQEFADPSFLCIDRQRRFLYSSHGDGLQATSYRVDEATGRLTPLNQQVTGGRNGTALAIDGTGRFLAVSNYFSGSLSLLPINADGSLGPLSDVVAMRGEAGPHRTQQISSHPHHCPFDPSGRFVVVPDKGLDRTFVFRVDTERGKLVEGKPPSAASRPGAAPRHVDFHPQAPYAYVINELDSTMTAFAFEPDKGVFNPLQTLSTLPSTYTGNNSTAEVWVAPSGRFIYGSNRGHDSIVIFSVDGETGMLTPVGWEPTQGRTPRYFALDPAGTHLYAANQNSDAIVIFRVDQQTGKLAATGAVVSVRSPSCVVFR